MARLGYDGTMTCPREERAAARKSKSGDLIENFLGSTQIFSLALTEIFEAKVLSELGDGQLTAAQMKVLKLIEQSGRQTVGAVATFLGVSDPAASKAVERLVKRGFVAREERKGDRRTSELALTQDGGRMVAEYDSARHRRLAQVFRKFSPGRLKSAAALLDRLAASIVTHNADPEEVCLQCGVFLKQRCLLQDVVRRTCSYRKRTADSQPEAGQSSRPARAPEVGET